MAGLTISGLRKSVGKHEALGGIDLTVPDGELCVIVGPSGSGKTTLLKIIAGLVRADAGTIAFAGEIVDDLGPRDRNVAMVPQSPVLFPHLTAFGNIAFGLRARKMPRTEMIPRVEDIAAKLGISELLERRPHQLSEGERQCVAIAHAMAREALVYLLDEPLSRLDSLRRDEMRAALKRLHRERAAPMVYVTHDHMEAMSLADRIVLLREGRVEQEGSPGELFERPATRFVAGFFGALKMNFLSGVAVRSQSGDAFRLAPEGMTVPLPPNRLPAAVADGSPVVLGIRPENMMRAVRVSPSDGMLRYEAVVELLQRTGTRVCATFRMGGEPVVAELQAHDVSAPGEKIALDINIKRAVLFDAGTGRALQPVGAGAAP